MQVANTSTARTVRDALNALRANRLERAKPDQSPLGGAGATTNGERPSRMIGPKPKGKEYPIEVRFQQRLQTLSRTLMIIEILTEHRDGASVAVLQREVSNRFGSVCSRTISRDLVALELLGIIDRDKGRQRWRVSDTSIRAAAIQQAAKVQAVARQRREVSERQCCSVR